jgi:hypothetical protein
MSAVPGNFMRQLPDEDSRRARQREADDATQAFWLWFAVGVLLFCWIAEATMCAVRGF